MLFRLQVISHPAAVGGGGGGIPSCFSNKLPFGSCPQFMAEAISQINVVVVSSET